jgi:hypothetical protein
MSKFNFMGYLTAKATTEDMVRYAFVKEYDLPFDTKDKNDNRTDGILFEFKYDKPMTKKDHLARIIAQAFYYVHRCLYGQVLAKVPKYIVVADKNEAAIFLANTYQDVYSSIAFDWLRKPCSPDEKLVNAVEDHAGYKGIHIYDLTQPSELALFSTALEKALKDGDILTDPSHVNLDNFEAVFEHWKGVIGEQIGEKHLAKYFINDLQKNTVFDEEAGTLVFKKLGGVEFSVTPKTYNWFWKAYRRPPKRKDMEGIIARADRLELMEKRRFTGDFFTPLPFAKLGLEYIASVLGEDWYKEYYVWDMACGTGNLEYHIPTYDNVFMSTLDHGEVSYLKDNNMFPGATIFQYDYLNDDVELLMMGENLLNDKAGWKLPRNLREALADKTKKWVVLMNPPYAEATAGVASGANKAGTSTTAIKNVMSQVDLGKAGNELFVQFMYRVHKEFKEGVQLGVYAKLKYVNSQAYESFRDKVFQPEYKKGFIFPSWAFPGTKGKWPVSFLLWDWTKQIPLESQNITMDEFNFDFE